LGQARLEPRPDPDGDILAGWVFELRDFVEVVVIQLFPQGPESRRDFGVIDQPAEIRVAGPGHGDFGLETVAMEPAAFVVGGQLGQQVGGLELEGFA
jgi:hypothetical protein